MRVNTHAPVFLHAHNAVALSTKIYCSPSKKGAPFVSYEEAHCPCLSSQDFSICHSAANQQFQRLTLNHSAGLTFSLSPHNVFQKRRSIQIYQTTSMLMLMVIGPSSFSSVSSVRTSRDVTTFIHFASAVGLRGPCAGAD